MRLMQPLPRHSYNRSEGNRSAGTVEHPHHSRQDVALVFSGFNSPHTRHVRLNRHQSGAAQFSNGSGIIDQTAFNQSFSQTLIAFIAAAMGDQGGKNKGKTGGKKTTTKIDQALSNEFSANKGKLPWPAEGRVVSHFGRNPHPVYTRLEMPFNNGVGLAVDKDAPVKAVFNGVVKQIVVVPGYNRCILVQHGEYFTFYCKMGSVAVKAGDKVKTGDVLGHVATGPDGTQLHFQLWKGRAPQDPEKWLR